jgi:hypothetical protein
LKAQKEHSSLRIIKKLFLNLSFFLSLNLFSEKEDCSQWFHKIADPRNLEIRIEDNVYKVYHKNGAHVDGVLDSKGQLTFSIKNKNAKGQRLLGKFYPKEALAEVIKHFGSRIKSIKSQWYIDHTEIGREMTTNIDQLNRALSEGKTFDEAVNLTWTAQTLNELGFSYSKTLYKVADPDDETKYYWVDLLFEQKKAN